MKGESTYNKYKRERKELMAIVDSDVQKFCISQKDFANRLAFLRRLMIQYRASEIEKLNDVKRDKPAP